MCLCPLANLRWIANRRPANLQRKLRQGEPDPIAAERTGGRKFKFDIQQLGLAKAVEEQEERCVLKFRVSRSTVAICLPLFVGVVLNGLVRPWLADELDGKLVRHGGAVRGSDRWWTFDAQMQIDHPQLTAFLTLSDGTIGFVTLAIVALLLLAIWVADRLGGLRR